MGLFDRLTRPLKAARKTVLDRAESGVRTRSELLEGINKDFLPFISGAAGSAEAIKHVDSLQTRDRERVRRQRLLALGLLGRKTPTSFGSPTVSRAKLLGN